MAAVDRISELPEPILHHILSFLSQNQAIQTSALSKTWRHVGPTRPKIELRERWFQKSGRATFLSVLGKTLQRYYHRNLSVHEFILDTWASESESKSDHQLIIIDHDKPLFNGLKRLSLTRVHIKAETLDKIIRSSPLMEYLLVSNCYGLTTIPETIFQAEFLTELHLTGCNLYTYGHLRGLNLIVTTDQLILIKRLKTLFLEKVCIASENLEKIMCGCPLIERVLLFDCVGLTNIILNNNNNNNLKHFSGSFCRVRTKSIEIHAPTIETIRIVDCRYWYGHDKYFFPRLKTLYLNSVKLSAEIFESLSSSFPSLEELQLVDCYGFRKIQLTVCSIKHLVIILLDSIEHMVISIYAPNIHYFKLSARYPSRLIFNTETAREWKSHVMLFNKCSGDKVSMLLWLRQSSELLNSLRKSQISLEVLPNPFKNLKVEDTNDAGFCKHVPLEDVSVEGHHKSSSFPYFLNGLFVICRPRNILMNFLTINPITHDLKKEKDKLAELITIRNEGEMSCGYLWVRDLEEISLQVWDRISMGWYTVGVEGTCFSGFTTCYPMIKFSVKWRD